MKAFTAWDSTNPLHELSRTHVKLVQANRAVTHFDFPGWEFSGTIIPKPFLPRPDTCRSGRGGRQLDYYFVCGKNMDAPLPDTGFDRQAPMYAMAYGYWQSKEHYRPAMRCWPSRRNSHCCNPIDASSRLGLLGGITN